MASVTFPPAVGGDGSTFTDDADVNTGLRRGGYKTRFLPVVTNTVNVANNAKTSAESALSSRTAAAASAAAALVSEQSAANFANAAEQTTLGFTTNRPTIRPSLNLDFVNQQVVDRRIVVNRNSPKTYFGKEKVLGDENLLRYSEDFSNGVWVKVNGTVAANTDTAPDGTLTADTFTATSSNATLRQSVTLSAVSYYFSVYIKRLVGTGAVELTIDGTTYEPVVIDGTFVRYDITQTPTAGAKSVGIRLVTSGDSVAVWAGQLEVTRSGQTKPTAYVRTDAYPVRTFFNKLQTAPANTMPIEFDPITQECLGIKPESQATNLLTYSEDFTNAVWVKVGGTLTSNVEVSPNAEITGDLFTATASNATLRQSFTASATPYVFSIWLKRKTGSGVVEITVDGTTYVPVTLTSLWTRLSTVLTPSAGTRNAGIRLVTSGDSVSVFGAQLEASTLGVPSSYIPTTTAQVTRLADDLSMPVSAFEYNQNEGTLYAEVNTPVAVDSGLGEVILEVGDATANNRIMLSRDSVNTGRDRSLQFLILNQSATQASINSINNFLPANSTNRISVSFTLNNVSLYGNSTSVATDTSAFIPTNSLNIYLGQVYTKTQQFNGYIRALRYYGKALSALEAQALSQV